MQTAIDAAGRVVVPTALCESLGLAPGQTLEITERDGHLVVASAPTSMRLIDDGDGLVAVTEMPTLTTDLVRETLERTRR
jgi:AbrB family looped-hinge helix DNA binding protein